MNIHQWDSNVKRISLEKDCEIYELAKKLDISPDSEALRNIISLGMDALHLGVQLEKTAKKLEETKEKLGSDLKEIAFQRIALESQSVGIRNQIVKSYRDNRALTMHLCTKGSRNEYERRMRDKFIQKYIIDSKLI